MAFIVPKAQCFSTGFREMVDRAAAKGCAHRKGPYPCMSCLGMKQCAQSGYSID